MVTASITSLWSISLQHLLRPYDLYGYNNYSVSMIYIVTANISFPCPTSLQQLLRPWSILIQPLLRPMISIVTTIITLQRSILKQQLRLYAPITTATIKSQCSIIQQLLRPMLYWYSNYYGPILYIVTITITSLWSILVQHILRHYHLSITATIPIDTA